MKDTGRMENREKLRKEDMKKRTHEGKQEKRETARKEHGKKDLQRQEEGKK